MKTLKVKKTIAKAKTMGDLMGKKAPKQMGYKAPAAKKANPFAKKGK